MEKRVLLAVVLSFIVLYGYQAMFPPPMPVQPGGQPGGQTGARPPAPAPSAVPQPAAVDPAPGVEAEALPAPVVADTEEREVVVENAFVRAVFSTRGGVLKSWRLKRYMDDGGQPLELVPLNVPAGSLKPFTLSVDDAAVTARLQRALYRPSQTAPADAAAGPGEIEFHYQDAGGLSVRKVFAFTPEQPYVIFFTANLANGGTPLVPTIHWGPPPPASLWSCAISS